MFGTPPPGIASPVPGTVPMVPAMGSLPATPLGQAASDLSPLPMHTPRGLISSLQGPQSGAEDVLQDDSNSSVTAAATAVTTAAMSPRGLVTPVIKGVDEALARYARGYGRARTRAKALGASLSRDSGGGKNDGGSSDGGSEGGSYSTAAPEDLSQEDLDMINSSVAMGAGATPGETDAEGYGDSSALPLPELRLDASFNAEQAVAAAQGRRRVLVRRGGAAPAAMQTPTAARTSGHAPTSPAALTPGSQVIAEVRSSVLSGDARGLIRSMQGVGVCGGGSGSPPLQADLGADTTPRQSIRLLCASGGLSGEGEERGGGSSITSKPPLQQALDAAAAASPGAAATAAASTQNVVDGDVEMAKVCMCVCV